MEEILKYENRDQLYQFLIDEFKLVKTEEFYDPLAFGNFYILLEAKDFNLSYVNDRGFLDINITSKLEPTKVFALSFVRDFLYNPDNINAENNLNNIERIKELNDFLRKDFLKICHLFSPENYNNTKTQILKLLKSVWDARFG